ncbi:hypothetical protein AZI86_18760 [Bdellovibrio bacteriovorus]|uniref:Uncharacterized protein n=1 Tax=Bdellovibrio bacteriovorus TaxID=959 RepID=A0A150WDJ7_BDEBC|nr:hypothetical protein [Bdellovibrio bacteriovorus]KYG60960.1 hypothetical protein AZI86_18760 [Bdellovibrio bacteriovorus]
MTKFLLAFATLSLSFAAQASQTTVKTAYTCEQDDGDIWYSIGLVPSLAPSKFNTVVVLNNEDDGTKTRLDDSAATLKSNGSGVIVFNKDASIKLVMDGKENGASGTLTILADGPGDIETAVICYKNSEITYDSNSSAEPRISVGN